ncbi:MAG: ABC-2 family transporter protein [Candidatus Amesbacteria bacterium]|nr:ABC-2 family transporter protein [Candidatus Amesbacteria bacterium]
MKPTVSKLVRYIRIFIILAKINYLKAMEYRLDFFSAVLPTGMYSAGYIVFINLIFSKVPSVSGWTFDQMLILFAVEQFFYYSGWIFYRGSIDHFPALIRDGTFDFVSKLPINTRFMVSFREQSPDILIPFFGSILVVVYASRNLNPSFVGVSLFVLFVLLGIIMLYNVLFTLASLSFWTTEADELVSLVDEVYGFGKYPLKIFPNFVGLFLLTIIPAVLMVYVPSSILMGIFDSKLITLFIVVLFVSWIISEKVWQAGLRHYSSASS